MEKLVFRNLKYETKFTQSVRIQDDTIWVIRQIQRKTGLNASYIVNEMIRFCADKIEIKE